MAEQFKNRKPLHRCLSYLEYRALPEPLQDEYLDWCQVQFECERARILYERQGGLKGLARKEAQQEVDWFQRVTTWSFLHAYIPMKRSDKHLNSQEMFNRVETY